MGIMPSVLSFFEVLIIFVGNITTSLVDNSSVYNDWFIVQHNTNEMCYFVVSVITGIVKSYICV